jgi:ABC-2 type transport system ATP-binding protein
MAVIEVTDLRKSYKDREVLTGVSFAVEEGEIFGLLGPNGAGKTTTVECAEGLRRRDGGSVRVLGLDPQHDRSELNRRVGVQLQQAQLQEHIRVREALDLYASFYEHPRDPDELLDQWGLRGRADAKFGKLSGGLQQRLFIALALIGNPQVVFLDELTSGLDPQARRDAWDLVRQVRDQGVTIVLVSHFMEEVTALCDRAAVLDGGRIIACGTPQELVAQAGAESSLSFQSELPLDLVALAHLPGVTRVTQDGPTVTVTGADSIVDEVTGYLARNRQVVTRLRVQQSGLDDAYIALTGGHQ